MIYLTITLSMLSGAFYVTGFAPFNLWFAPIVSILIMMMLLNKKNHWEGGLIGLFFGIGLMGVGISWIYNSISTYSSATNEQAALVTAFFCFVMALFYAVHGYIYCWFNFSKRSIFVFFDSSTSMRVLSFSLLWILLELIRSHLYVGFPWLLLGNAMIETYLAPWAPIGGGFLVGLWVCLTAACVYHALKLLPSIYVRRHQYKLLGLVFIALLPWAIGSRFIDYNWTQETRQLSVTVVQGNIPQEQKWDPNFADEIIGRYRDSTFINLNKELIVWPEAATPYVYPQGGQVHNDINERLKINGVKLVYGGLRSEPNSAVYNSIFVAGEHDEIQKVYDKNILVPFGEFIPFTSLGKYIPGLFNDIDMTAFITKAGDKPQPFAVGDLMISPSICYEIAHGEYISKLSRNSNLLISISNDAWFGNSLGPHQHMHAARMRALENQLYLIRASNNGVSGIVNDRGIIVAQIPQFQYDTLTHDVAIRRGSTPYQTVGDLPVWAVSIGGLWLCLWRRKRLINKV
ncbi:MAG: apolipoprotein N-acyltransferase [Gammaproteobacteria bacterium]|nr:apolipoprotein N-acyltransferase [Gammaproteobacteria bacterium]